MPSRETLPCVLVFACSGEDVETHALESMTVDLATSDMNTALDQIGKRDDEQLRATMLDWARRAEPGDRVVNAETVLVRLPNSCVARTYNIEVKEEVVTKRNVFVKGGGATRSVPPRKR